MWRSQHLFNLLQSSSGLLLYYKATRNILESLSTYRRVLEPSILKVEIPDQKVWPWNISVDTAGQKGVLIYMLPSHGPEHPFISYTLANADSQWPIFGFTNLINETICRCSLMCMFYLLRRAVPVASQAWAGSSSWPVYFSILFSPLHVYVIGKCPRILVGTSAEPNQKDKPASNSCPKFRAEVVTFRPEVTAHDSSKESVHRRQISSPRHFLAVLIEVTAKGMPALKGGSVS